MSAAASAADEHGLPAEIPLGVLFGNADKHMARLSPDGRYYAYLADDADGVANVFLQRVPLADDGPKAAAAPCQLTREHERPLRHFQWAKSASPRRVLFVQDKGGDENFHLFAADFSVDETQTDEVAVTGLVVRDLTPFDGATVEVSSIETSAQAPEFVRVAINRRDPTLFDAVRIHAPTGELTVDVENPGDVVGWFCTDDLEVRAAAASNPKDGSTTLRVRQSDRDGADAAAWPTIATWPHGEIGNVHGFTKDGSGIYVESTLAHAGADTDGGDEGVNTSRLLVLSANDGHVREVLASDPQCDVARVSFGERSRAPEFCVFDYDLPRVHVLDEALRADIECLVALSSRRFERVSASADDQLWVVADQPADASTKYFLFDRRAKTRALLFDSRPALAAYALADMQPRTIATSDGHAMVAYLTLPRGVPAHRLPLVLNVHGGPWSRNAWGYNAEHQFFANRGYACLSVNFRGSTGYGKRWINLGDKQWGGTMQRDLTDAVRWAVAEGVADSARVAIYGGSYGGYAALAGLAFTPDLFACGVDIVGPSNARTLLASIPPYWEPMRKMLLLRVGDVEADEELNRRISPLFHADKICRPLLIAQGANDPRVKQAESDQIAKELHANKHPVTYVLYSDEGHGFARPPNKLDFTSRAEKFLAEHLGGRCFPVDPALVKGTTGQEVDVATL